MEARTQSPEKFRSPEEELVFLRSEVERKERELLDRGLETSKDSIIQKEIEAYKEKPAETVLHESHQISQGELETLAMGLSPESHDSQIIELVEVLHARGIKNALSIAAKLHNPHIDDDLERFLVQYVKSGFTVGLQKNDPLFRALHMTLFEVMLPESEMKDDREKTLKELISSMEQFYAGMLSVGESGIVGPNYFTIELAVENHSNEFVFYVAVPDGKRELFEKQILSIFPQAKLRESKNDYNVFNDTGKSAGSVASLKETPIFPLKTYDQFDHDPLNVILNSFSKIDKEGEGAAIQITFFPVGDHYSNIYRRSLDQVLKGQKLHIATDIPDSAGGHVWKFAKEVLRDLSTSSKKVKEEDKKIKEPPKVDEVAVQNITNKISSPIISANIRIITSSRTEREAEEILADIESAFNQFENPHHGNKLKFNRKHGGSLLDLFHNFSYRLFSQSEALPLNIRELTTFMHFPGVTVAPSPQLRISKAATAPAPMGLSSEGIVLGINRDRNTETIVQIAPEDRLRHFYAIGQTGTGKTTLLKNMAVQDILAGEGVCFIDPHGSDIEDILSVIPTNRFEDVVYFEPAYIKRPMALNMLEYSRDFPEQKTFVVNELFSIFQKLYGAVPESMGPMFEQYFRNATLLVIEDPDTGSTLIDVSRVLSNKAYRDLKISRCKNPVVIQFWKEVAEKAGGEAALANIVPYITSKFDVFLANDIMRPIIAQEHSSFNFRDIMDHRKIMLVNLSKGRLGDINANLIGLILVGKILMAALSRVDSIGKDLPPFYLYIDEFQNITTDSIATILSEARKYHLAMVIAHQFIAQLDEKIRDSVFGNVGSIASFRVGSEDAEFLEKQFAPVFSAKDLMNLDNHNVYVKMLAGGRTVKPFSLETRPPDIGKKDQIERLKELSYLKFGRERSDVENEILKKYQK